MNQKDDQLEPLPKHVLGERKKRGEGGGGKLDGGDCNKMFASNAGLTFLECHLPKVCLLAGKQFGVKY